MHTSESKKIKLHEPHFTHKEVMEITGIPDRTLLMWKQRNVIDFFQDTFTENRGRRLFAPIDVMLVGVLFEIVSSIGVKPSEYSSAVSIALSTRPQELLSIDHYKYLQYDKSSINKIMRAELNDPVLMTINLISKHAEFGFKRTSKIKKFYETEDSLSFSKSPHVVVPIDAILLKIRDKMKESFDIEIE